jgi:HK97 family phage major capsid protein
MIELLRNRTALLRLGAVLLTGLGPPIEFAKQTGAVTAYWGTENPASAVSASDPAFAPALLTPKPLQAVTSYSRQLLATASVAVDSLVENDIARVNSIAVDFAGIHGLGAAGEPQGIYGALNVSATAVGGAMTYAKILAMQGQVAGANADVGSLGWLMHPTMATNLKGTPMFSNTATPIWDGPYEEGRVGGYKAVATNQVSKTMTGSARTGGTEIGSLFGNWADVIVGQWGPGMELVTDPYTLADKGMIKVVSFLLADVLVRHGESFSKSTGATG